MLGALGQFVKRAVCRWDYGEIREQDIQSGAFRRAGHGPDHISFRVWKWRKPNDGPTLAICGCLETQHTSVNGHPDPEVRCVSAKRSRRPIRLSNSQDAAHQCFTVGQLNARLDPDAFVETHHDTSLVV